MLPGRDGGEREKREREKELEKAERDSAADGCQGWGGGRTQEEWNANNDIMVPLNNEHEGGKGTLCVRDDKRLRAGQTNTTNRPAMV